MDRERRLLCTAVILAVVENAMLFAIWRNDSGLPSCEAVLEDDRTCHERLTRTYAACLPKLGPIPGRGI